MSTRKINRAVIAGVQSMGLRITYDGGSRGHIRFTVEHADGRKQPLMVSSSPRDEDNAVNNVMQEVRRFARNA